jgi:hypothetical protein
MRVVAERQKAAPSASNPRRGKNADLGSLEPSRCSAPQAERKVALMLRAPLFCACVVLSAACQSKAPPAGVGGSGSGDRGNSGAAGSGGSAPDPASDEATHAPLSPGKQGVSQIVYDRGLLARPRAMAVDGKYLYWSEQTASEQRVVQAPKDGSGPITRLGSGSGSAVSGRIIVVDESYVYWREDDHLNKVSKTTYELTTLPIGFNKPGGPLLLTESHLFVASPNCQQVARIAKDGSTSDVFLNDVVTSQRGGTSLVEVDNKIVCATRDQVTTMPTAGGPFEEVLRLTTGEEIMFGDTVALGDVLYWSHSPTAGQGKDQLARAKLGEAEIQLLAPLGGSAQVVSDESRGTVYALPGQNWLPLYAYREAKVSVVAKDQYRSGGLVGDDQYLYWARTAYSINGRSVGNELVRISKEMPPE